MSKLAAQNGPRMSSSAAGSLGQFVNMKRRPSVVQTSFLKESSEVHKLKTQASKNMKGLDASQGSSSLLHQLSKKKSIVLQGMGNSGNPSGTLGGKLLSPLQHQKSSSLKSPNLIANAGPMKLIQNSISEKDSSRTSSQGAETDSDNDGMDIEDLEAELEKLQMKEENEAKGTSSGNKQKYSPQQHKKVHRQASGSMTMSGDHTDRGGDTNNMLLRLQSSLDKENDINSGAGLGSPQNQSYREANSRERKNSFKNSMIMPSPHQSDPVVHLKTPVVQQANLMSEIQEESDGGTRLSSQYTGMRTTSNRGGGGGGENHMNDSGREKNININSQRNNFSDQQQWQSARSGPEKKFVPSKFAQNSNNNLKKNFENNKQDNIVACDLTPGGTNKNNNVIKGNHHRIESTDTRHSNSRLVNEEEAGVGGKSFKIAEDSENSRSKSDIPRSERLSSSRSQQTEKDEYFLNISEISEFERQREPELRHSQDVRMSTEIYNRIVVVEYICVFFAFFGICLSMVLNELTEVQEIDNETQRMVLGYIMLLSFFLAIAIYLRYELYVQWYMAQNLLTEFDNLISTGWWHNMVLEQVLALVAPYPFLQGIKYVEENTDWHVTISYEINQILMCLSFTRVYILLRYHLFMSTFMSPRSTRLCSMNGCEAGHMFAIKSIMKQRPYTFLFYTLVLTIFFFGYQLKVFEGPLSKVSNQNFNLLQNSMWNVIITLTTTGYGDFYPKSLLGRSIGLIICFWGTFMVSFFVVTVNNMLTFSPSEEKSFNLLQRLHFKEELKEYAVNVLSSAYKHRNLRIVHEGDENNSRTMKALRHFRTKILSFKQAVIRVRNFYEGESEMDILQRQIDQLHDEVKAITDDQTTVQDGFHQVLNMIESINAKINSNSLSSSQISQALSDDSLSDRGMGASRSTNTAASNMVLQSLTGNMKNDQYQQQQQQQQKGASTRMLNDSSSVEYYF